MRRTGRVLRLTSVMMLVVATGAASAGAQTPAPADRMAGGTVELGKGTVSSYARLRADDTPDAIGVVFSAGALDGLPAGSDAHHCFDRNQDGVIDVETECVHGFEYVIPLPDAVARRVDIPFKWVLLNWNPAGHNPPGVYDVPHFDVHFYMEPIANVFAIQSGPCGPELVRCDQFATARRPVPSNYAPPDFKDVGAVTPAMGNHLIDVTGPEFQKQPFTRSWIVGTYDGAVTFYEEMVARTFLLGRPDTCSAIKSPPAVGRTGFYPSVSCVRYDPEHEEYSVSMERFVFRRSEPPAAR